MKRRKKEERGRRGESEIAYQSVHANATTKREDPPHSVEAAGACFPVSHAWQLLVTLSRNCPAAQGRQRGLPVPPAAVPLAQVLQMWLPAWSEKVPVAHSSQPLCSLGAASIVPRVPGGHCVQVVAPWPLYVPTAQRAPGRSAATGKCERTMILLVSISIAIAMERRGEGRGGEKKRRREEGGKERESLVCLSFSCDSGLVLSLRSRLTRA